MVLQIAIALFGDGTCYFGNGISAALKQENCSSGKNMRQTKKG